MLKDKVSRTVRGIPLDIILTDNVDAAVKATYDPQICGHIELEVNVLNKR